MPPVAVGKLPGDDFRYEPASFSLNACAIPSLLSSLILDEKQNRYLRKDEDQHYSTGNRFFAA